MTDDYARKDKQAADLDLIPFWAHVLLTRNTDIKRVMMNAFLLSCAACIPLIGIYHLVTRVPTLAILVLLLSLTVGTSAGAMYR